MVERRIGGLPLEQVVGWAAFHGLRIEVDPGVFVPRRRTELLVDEALIHLSRGGQPPARHPSSSTSCSGVVGAASWRFVTTSSCTPPTSTRSPSAAPAATSPPPEAPSTRVISTTPCRSGCEAVCSWSSPTSLTCPATRSSCCPGRFRLHEPLGAVDETASTWLRCAADGAMDGSGGPPIVETGDHQVGGCGRLVHGGRPGRPARPLRRADTTVVITRPASIHRGRPRPGSAARQTPRSSAACSSGVERPSTPPSSAPMVLTDRCVAPAARHVSACSTSFSGEPRQTIRPSMPIVEASRPASAAPASTKPRAASRSAPGATWGNQPSANRPARRNAGSELAPNQTGIAGTVGEPAPAPVTCSYSPSNVTVRSVQQPAQQLDLLTESSPGR